MAVEYLNQSVAAPAVIIDITPPSRIVYRGPKVSPIQPMIGAPTGVPPMKTARYRAITRPRIAGVVLSWMVALAAVISVREDSPTGINEMANDQ